MTQTARNFALQLGALATLYAALSSFIVLVFGLINLAFPDAVDAYWQIESTQSSMRFAIATLVVVFPAYLILTRTVNQIRRHDKAGAYVGIMRWLIYLSLLVGGGVLLGDLVSVIYTFLNGEITTRFILKALVLLIIIGAACFYYLKDAQTYWLTRERQSLLYGAGMTVCVMAALVFGFLNIETPDTVREMRLDDQQITDLQDIQYRTEEYYRVHKELPVDIATLYDGISPPAAPDDRAAYAYHPTADQNYQLCATFATTSQESPLARPTLVTEKNYSWTHGQGNWCFERVIATPGK